MVNVTAILLNWQRPDNMKKTIDSIRNQDVDIDIWLFNNNPNDKTQYDVENQINSGKNLICWPRWFMGSMVKTKYIFTLDDDLIIIKDDIISKCISTHENNNITDLIIGPYGKMLSGNKDYRGLEVNVNTIDSDKTVDIIKGRFMFMQRDLLNNVSLENEETCEDIKISSYSNNKLVPNFMVNGFENLIEGSEALFARPNRLDERANAIKKYFK